MNGPLISVVVPTRNRAHILFRSLDSLRVQTYPHWEAIVVDDYSDDATWRTLGYIGDSRIRYVRNTGSQGVVHARNLGVAHAEGEIISYLDDDNQFYPSALESLSEMPEDVDWGACYRNITLIQIERQREVARHRGTSAGRDMSRSSLVSLETSIDSNCLFHRSAILSKIGGWDSLVEPTGFEDLYLGARLALMYYDSFWLLPQVLVEYQTTVGSDGDGLWGRNGFALHSQFIAEWLRRYGNELTEGQRATLSRRVILSKERALRKEPIWADWFKT